MLARVFQRTGAVAIGTGLGQGLILLATPFLARMYPPADFGALAVLVTVSNISMAVACLRYDIAIPVAAESDVRALFGTSAFAATLVGATTAVVLVLLPGKSTASVSAGALLKHPIMVGTCVVIVGLYQATGAWLLRRNAFNAVAALRLSQGGAFSALAACPSLGLLWAHVVSFAGGLLGAWKALSRPGNDGISWKDTGRRYRQFPLYNVPGSLLDVVGYSVSIWTVAAIYGPATAGEYSQVQRLIGAPLMLISVSMSQILLRHTADLMHDKPAMRLLLLKLFGVMAVFAVGALGGLWCAGAPAIRWILGASWHVERETVMLLGLAVFVRACVSPVSSALLVLRRFGLTLSWQASYCCSMGILMPVVARTCPFRSYLIFYALHECVFYAAYMLLILVALRNNKCAESSVS